MKKLLLYSSIALITAATGLAKDKDDKKKDKDKDKDKDRVVYVERDGQRYTVDRDGKRHRIDDGDRHYENRDARDDRRDDRDYRDYRGDSRDRTRTIYVIQGNRPVEQTVYIGTDGRYYRSVDGRRSYISERHYESYPSKYYYPDGRRRLTITLPF